MPTLTAPVLAGAPLPRPNRYRAEPRQLVDDRELAAGVVKRYHRGTRTRFVMEWDTMREADLNDLRVTVEAVQRSFVVPFVAMDGSTRAVLVTDWNGGEPIPGTDPHRYVVRLTVEDQRPR